MKCTLSLMLFIVLLGTTALAADSIPYETGFEASEGFTAGQSIDGQNGWQVLSTGADATVIDDAAAQEGGQSVSLEANSQIDKPLTAGAEDSIIWMEGYFKGSGTSAEPDFPDTPAASAIVFFGSDGIKCYNGDQPAETAWEEAGVSPQSDSWIKISIRQNYTTKKWRCYIDESPAPDKDLGFRDDVASLNGFRNFADTASFLDAFRVIPAKKGDANADGKVDAADIVTLINDPSGSAMGLIEKDNADVDDDGGIDADDLDSLISQMILNVS